MSNVPSENKQRQGIRVLPGAEKGERTLNDIFAELNGGSYNPTTYRGSASVPSFDENNQTVKPRSRIPRLIAWLLVILAIAMIIWAAIALAQ